MLEDNDALNGDSPEVAPQPQPEFETQPETQPEPQPEEKGNRLFLIIGGIFAALIFLTLLFAALYFMLIRPNSLAAKASQEATLSAQRLEQSQALTATAEAGQSAALSSPMPLQTTTVMSAATQTPVVVVSSGLATPSSDPATLAALQTQLAGQMTQTASLLVTSEVGGTGPLPTTGFFDEVGLPLMIVLTFALLVVILVARRMRKSTH